MLSLESESWWYDAPGRQIKACGYGVLFLTLDGQSIVRAENWRVRQVPGLDDPLIALARNDVVNEGVIPQEIYYLTDGAGRHYAVAEATGSIRTEIWNETASQYLGFRATGAVTQSHSFDEERLSTERTPGLSFFRNRVYDQDTGRWTQEDPIGIVGGINPQMTRMTADDTDVASHYQLSASSICIGVICGPIRRPAAGPRKTPSASQAGSTCTSSTGMIRRAMMIRMDCVLIRLASR